MLSPVILVIHTDDSVMSALHIKLVIYSQLDIVGIDLINMSLSSVFGSFFKGHYLRLAQDVIFAWHWSKLFVLKTQNLQANPYYMSMAGWLSRTRSTMSLRWYTGALNLKVYDVCCLCCKYCILRLPCPLTLNETGRTSRDSRWSYNGSSGADGDRQRQRPLFDMPQRQRQRAFLAWN